MESRIRSYTSHEGQVIGFMRELRQLARRSLGSHQHVCDEVARVVNAARVAEDFLYQETAMRPRGLRVLEIGVGQLPRQLAYFAAYNDVVGIDLDVIPHGIDVLGYSKMFRQNGLRRVIKTLGRKLLMVDRRFEREMRRQLGIDRLTLPRVLQMDAGAMEFEAESFDLIYSFDVMEHIPDPRAVLRHVKRVLRPGGCSLHYIHPYTADDGCHDLRLIVGRRGNLPYWPHLRPQHRDEIHQFSYLNALTLRQWRELLENELPGSRFLNWRMDGTGLEEPLRQLRAAGELADHTDEDLLTDRLIAVWKKPLASSVSEGR